MNIGATIHLEPGDHNRIRVAILSGGFATLASDDRLTATGFTLFFEDAESMITFLQISQEKIADLVRIRDASESEKSEPKDEKES